MFIAGCKKVCCCVVKLISFELYKQNAVKKANFEEYLAKFVMTISTSRLSSQAAKSLLL